MTHRLDTSGRGAGPLRGYSGRFLAIAAAAAICATAVAVALSLGPRGDTAPAETRNRG